MSDDRPDTSSPHSASTFLGNLERSGILTESGIHEVRELLDSEYGLHDPVAIAERLVKRGQLTEFQARRLLVGRGTGLVFGRYVLLDRLGRGSMGRVLKARHRLMDRVVALKVVSPAYASSMHSVSRFLREMKIVGLLDHPNVVRAFDADQQDDSPYIVMEYLEGEDLERILRTRGMLPPDEVLEYMVQAAWGLAHAHEKGVVHRDVKPTNLFLTSAGVVKVLDLGLGAFVGVANESVKPLDTDEGYAVGTTDYMSPEQISGQAVDARTDLFSLGCTMYRLLTGRYAFPGMTKIDRLARRLHEAHQPINEVRQNLPTPMIAVLDRMLCLRPDDRFSSAVDVAESIEALMPWSARKRVSETNRAGKTPRIPSSTATAEPEAPLDWSRIESALQTKREQPAQPEAASSRSGDELAKPSPSSLNLHRKRLEAEGDQSGREVQREYRKKVIELKRAQIEQQKEESELPAPGLAESWMERVGEQIGDFLAEPSAGHLFIVLSVITLVIAATLAFALN